MVGNSAAATHTHQELSALGNVGELAEGRISEANLKHETRTSVEASKRRKRVGQAWPRRHLAMAELGHPS